MPGDPGAWELMWIFSDMGKEKLFFLIMTFTKVFTKKGRDMGLELTNSKMAPDMLEITQGRLRNKKTDKL